MPSFLSSISSFFSPQSPTSTSTSTQTPLPNYPTTRRTQFPSFGFNSTPSSSTTSGGRGGGGGGGRERVQRDTNEAFRLPRYLADGRDGEGSGDGVGSGGLGLGFPERGYIVVSFIFVSCRRVFLWVVEAPPGGACLWLGRCRLGFRENWRWRGGRREHGVMRDWFMRVPTPNTGDGDFPQERINAQ